MEADESISRQDDWYGLIGYPLDHSFSPAYFRQKFLQEQIRADYSAFPITSIDELLPLIASMPQLRGLNVTTPYKESVIPFLNDLSPEARAIGAVNCIVIRNGQLTGHNTDWTGFRDSLPAPAKAEMMKALVLGAGGASHAIRYALRQMDISYHTVSQTEGKGDFVYRDLTADIIENHHLIINTTVLGTKGKGLPDLPYSALQTGRHMLYDLVYNPAVTPFMEEGLKYGAAVKNGEEMLIGQAEASWILWQERR